MLVKTGDDSFTMYSKEYDEHYHCLSEGALNESFSKHIIPAFRHIDKDEVHILDICFGLGYNTLATLHYLQDSNKKIYIYSPELDKELIKSLKEFQYPKELAPYKDIIDTLIQKQKYSSDNINIELFIGDAREYIKTLQNIDILYQDAFSPKKNPSLWSYEYFKDIKSILNDDAIITTYSQSTYVRMSMYENGFLLYENENENVRSGTLASLKPLDLPQIDMELKIQRNPNAKAIYDEDIN